MKIQKYITAIIVAVGVFGGTAAGIWLSGGGKQYLSNNAAPPRTLAAASSGAELPHTRGGTDAPATMEAFVDFQCPPCAELRGELKKLEAEFGSRLRIVFRHYPLKMHKNAELAARAAESAGSQGKFWEMYDLLYERQTDWSESDDAGAIFAGMAKELGLDLSRFAVDIDSPRIKMRVFADKERGESVDIQGTPTLFVNGVEITEESMTVEGVRSKIERAIR